MSILERIRIWKVATAAKWRQLLTDSGVELNPYQRPHQERMDDMAMSREGGFVGSDSHDPMK